MARLRSALALCLLALFCVSFTAVEASGNIEYSSVDGTLQYYSEVYAGKYDFANCDVNCAGKSFALSADGSCYAQACSLDAKIGCNVEIARVEGADCVDPKEYYSKCTYISEFDKKTVTLRDGTEQWVQATETKCNKLSCEGTDVKIVESSEDLTVCDGTAPSVCNCYFDNRLFPENSFVGYNYTEAGCFETYCGVKCEATYKTTDPKFCASPETDRTCEYCVAGGYKYDVDYSMYFIEDDTCMLSTCKKSDFGCAYTTVDAPGLCSEFFEEDLCDGYCVDVETKKRYTAEYSEQVLENGNCYTKGCDKETCEFTYQNEDMAECREVEGYDDTLCTCEIYRGYEGYHTWVQEGEYLYGLNTKNQCCNITCQDEFPKCDVGTILTAIARPIDESFCATTSVNESTTACQGCTDGKHLFQPGYSNYWVTPGGMCTLDTCDAECLWDSVVLDSVDCHAEDVNGDDCDGCTYNGVNYPLGTLMNEFHGDECLSFLCNDTIKCAFETWVMPAAECVDADIVDDCTCFDENTNVEFSEGDWYTLGNTRECFNYTCVRDVASNTCKFDNAKTDLEDCADDNVIVTDDSGCEGCKDEDTFYPMGFAEYLFDARGKCYERICNRKCNWDVIYTTSAEECADVVVVVDEEPCKYCEWQKVWYEVESVIETCDADGFCVSYYCNPKTCKWDGTVIDIVIDDTPVDCEVCIHNEEKYMIGHTGYNFHGDICFAYTCNKECKWDTFMLKDTSPCERDPLDDVVVVDECECELDRAFYAIGAVVEYGAVMDDGRCVSIECDKECEWFKYVHDCPADNTTDPVVDDGEVVVVADCKGCEYDKEWYGIGYSTFEFAGRECIEYMCNKECKWDKFVQEDSELCKDDTIVDDVVVEDEVCRGCEYNRKVYPFGFELTTPTGDVDATGAEQCSYDVCTEECKWKKYIADCAEEDIIVVDDEEVEGPECKGCEYNLMYYDFGAVIYDYTDRKECAAYECQEKTCKWEVKILTGEDAILCDGEDVVVDDGTDTECPGCEFERAIYAIGDTMDMWDDEKECASYECSKECKWEVFIDPEGCGGVVVDDDEPDVGCLCEYNGAFYEPGFSTITDDVTGKCLSYYCNEQCAWDRRALDDSECNCEKTCSGADAGVYAGLADLMEFEDGHEISYINADGECITSICDGESCEWTETVDTTAEQCQPWITECDGYCYEAQITVHSVLVAIQQTTSVTTAATQWTALSLGSVITPYGTINNDSDISTTTTGGTESTTVTTNTTVWVNQTYSTTYYSTAVVGYGTYSIDYDADGNEICLWTSCEENCLFQTVQADPRDCGIDTSDGADTGDIVVCYDENKLPVEVGVVEYMWSGELCVAYTCGEDGQWIKELAEKVEYCPAVVSEDVVSEVTFHVYVCDRWEALVDSDVYKKLILAEYGDYIKTELGLDSYQLVSIYDLLKLSATDEENEYALYQLTIFFGDADTANSIVDLINTLSKKFDQDCLKVTIVDGEVIRAEADVQVYQCAATGSYSKSQEECASAWEQFVEDGGEDVDVVDLTDLMGSSSLLREFQGSATSVSVSSVALLFVALVAAIIQVN